MLTRTSDYDSVGEKTYRRIRTDIVFGRLAPSAKLKLDRMREEYQLKDVVWQEKGSISGSSPASLVDDMARRCDAIVIAAGCQPQACHFPCPRFHP